MRIAFHTGKGTASQPHFWPGYWKSVSLHLNSKYLPEYPVLLNHVRSGAEILDIGCGRGVVVRDLLQQGFKARGIDFDADSIFDSAAMDGPFPAEVGDLNKLPYPDESFDAVLLAGTVEHVYGGPERGFAEAFRALRPGGVMVLTIPYINLVRKLVLPFYLVRGWLFSFFPEARKERFFEYVFTKSEVVRMLSNAGFTVTESRRAYYTTVLRKVPGMKRATEAIFGESRKAIARGPAGSASARPTSTSGTKRVLKKIIEGTLNRIIANRLIVVARKPAGIGVARARRQDWAAETGLRSAAEPAGAGRKH